FARYRLGQAQVLRVVRGNGKCLVQRVLSWADGDFRRAFVIVDRQVFSTRDRMLRYTQGDEDRLLRGDRSTPWSFRRRAAAFLLAPQQADHSSLDDQLCFLDFRVVEAHFKSLR